MIGGRDAASFSRPFTARDRRSSPPIGPPRLPHELISHIILLASEFLVDKAQRDGKSPSKDLLRLSSVDREAYAAILSQFILPSLQLTGVRQVHAFSRDLVRNTLGIRRLSHRIKRLTVSRIIPQGQAQRSLYADVEETARFERTTLLPLRTILSCCSGLEYLSLDMSARVLDLRWPDDMDKGGLMRLCNSLKELITMLSLYGGDLNERLWDVSYGAAGLGAPRWANLTSLQLHGPRFRMTALTALALCDLPRLTHLALIMPWIVNATMNGDAVSSDVLARHAGTIDRATDALGRQSVLQLLLSGVGHRLTRLLLICHDMEGYLGSAQKLGPWFRALHWHHTASPTSSSINLRTNSDGHRTILPSSTQLQLVTAKLHINDVSKVDPHPSLLSKWMMQRSQSQRHWTFNDGEVNEIAGATVTVSNEVWRVPVEEVGFMSVPDDIPISSNDPRSGPQTDFDTAQRWMGIDQRASSGEDTLWDSGGIDNLD